MTYDTKSRAQAFMWGAGSVVDISGGLVRRASCPDGWRAIAGDFSRVGGYLCSAAKTVGQDVHEQSARQLSLPLNG